MCGIISRSVSATGWSVRQIGRIVLRWNGRDSLVAEFGQQLAFWVALCVAITAVYFDSVEHFVPFVVERILRGFKPLLLLLQDPRGGNKPSVEVLLFQMLFWDDVCIIVRIVLLSGDRFISFVFGIVVIGQWPRTVFVVPWLILLHRWVYGVFIIFSVVRGITLSCAGIAIFAMEGFRAAPLTLALCLLLEGIILR